MCEAKAAAGDQDVVVHGAGLMSRCLVRSSRPGWYPFGQVATLVAMSVEPQMPLKDVKNRLSEVVDQIEREHGRVVITKHGRPAAVVVSVEDLESLEETLDVLARPKLIAQVRDSLTELDREPAQVLSKDEALGLRG
jgi:antitoxin YefM